MSSYVSASIDVTYLCNMRCRHCYNRSNRKDPREMSREKLLEVCREIANLRVESVCFCGGEPLCRLSDVIDMAKTIKSIDPSKAISMVTNGLLWDENTGSLLRSAGIMVVQFSLDGFSDESYDLVRRSGGNLRKVFEAIDIALSAGLRVMICTLPHKKSLPEMDDIIAFCNEKRVESLRVQPFMPIGRGEESFEELALSQEEYAVLRKKLHEANSSYPDLRIEWGDPIDHFYMMQDIGAIPGITINAYGEIMLSPYLPIAIWDLTRHTLAEFDEKNVSRNTLRIPIVRKVLSEMVDISDLKNEPMGMPELFLGKNIDLTDELAAMEG